MVHVPRIGVMGAGAVGCYVGGMLAERGENVVLIGRARAKIELASGLVLTDVNGVTTRVAADRFAFDTDVAKLADCDVVLVCVKSSQTSEVATQLAGVVRSDAIVVSFQNGIRNADELRAGLPGRTVLGGIVGFNVLAKGGGAFHQATTGELVIEACGTFGSACLVSHEASPSAHTSALATALERSGFRVELATDIRAIQWSKLIMNLNNAVSALTNAPTRELIFVKDYRRILHAIISESLAVLDQAGIRTARLGVVPVRWFPYALRLPTPLLRIFARAQVKIDPEARSSMWDDLSKGRLTEVDYLNGEIVKIAASYGADAPVNRRVVEIVHRAEKAAQGSPKLSADALWAELTAG